MGSALWIWPALSTTPVSPPATSLMLATLKHFGHSERIRLQLMHSEHCAYRGTFDENGVNHFGKLVEDFIRAFPV